MNEALAGFKVVAKSSASAGKLYVVPKTTTPNSADIVAAKIGEAVSAGAGADTTISIDANKPMADGAVFVVYAIDGANNVSPISSDAFTVDYSDTSSISINTPVNANVPTSGGKDVYKLDLTAGITYTFTTSNSTDTGGIGDPTLRLYLHDGTNFSEVTYDDDDGPGNEAEIIYTSTQSATYYIMVEGYYPEDVGTTTITITQGL